MLARMLSMFLSLTLLDIQAVCTLSSNLRLDAYYARPCYGEPYSDASYTGHRRVRVRLSEFLVGVLVANVMCSMYHAMVEHISVDSTVLLDPQTAPAEIDRCLTSMMQQSRPVYIGVPVDMSHLECDASALKTPLPRALSPNDPQLEKDVVGKLRKMMEQSKNPIIIVDGFAVRNNLQNQCQELSRLTGFPTFNTYMGKGGIDETMPNFGGLYTGAGTYEGVKKAVESADAVFWIGNVQVCMMSHTSSGNVLTSIDRFQHRRVHRRSRRGCDCRIPARVYEGSSNCTTFTEQPSG